MTDMTEPIRPAEPPAPESAPLAPKRRLTWLWVLLAVTATAGITYAVAAPRNEPAAEESPSTIVTTSPSQSPEDYAIEKCRDAVERQLKAPATAVWPGGETVSVSTDYTYTVRGEVDSENGFGALIRSTWVCDYRASAGTTDAYVF